MTRTLRVGAAVALGLCLFLSSHPAGSDDTSETYRQLHLFGYVFERVRSSSVAEVSVNAQVESAINGIVN